MLLLNKKEDHHYNIPLGVLFMGGTIRCYKCGHARDSKSYVCPRCGYHKVYISIYWKGKMYQFTRHYQTDTTMTYDLADRMLTVIQSQVDNKTFNPEDWKIGKIRERRFENKIFEWLDQKKEEMHADEFSAETYKNYKGYVHNHFIPFFEKWDIRDINHELLLQFKNEISKKKIKIKTRKNIINALHAFFTWCRNTGAIKEIPVWIEITGDDAHVRTAITYEAQLEGINRIPEAHRDIFIFSFETGLRPGELIALKPKDMEPEGKKALIQRTFSGSKLMETTKSKTKRWIPLSDTAFQVAMKHAQDKHPESFLFINPETKRRYTTKKLNQLWRQCSGINCTHYEAGRHSFCTQLVEQGIDIAIVKELARHSDIRTTQKYTHIRTSRLHEVVNRRGEIVELKKGKNLKQT